MNIPTIQSIALTTALITWNAGAKTTNINIVSNVSESCAIFLWTTDINNLSSELEENFKQGIELIEIQTWVKLFRGEVDKILEISGNTDSTLQKSLLVSKKEAEKAVLKFRELMKQIDQTGFEYDLKEMEELIKKFNWGQLTGFEKLLAEAKIIWYQMYQEMKYDMKNQEKKMKDAKIIDWCSAEWWRRTIWFAWKKESIIWGDASTFAHEIMHKILLGKVRNHHTDSESDLAEHILVNWCSSPTEVYEKLCEDNLMCSVDINWWTKLSSREIEYVKDINKQCSDN